jgi:multidrug resistance efflux pump
VDKTYCIEIRLDVTGDEAAVRAKAVEVAAEVGGYVTAIFDADWEELD